MKNRHYTKFQILERALICMQIVPTAVLTIALVAYLTTGAELVWLANIGMVLGFIALGLFVVYLIAIAVMHIKDAVEKADVYDADREEF